jgi:tetratricopeptide (TPR) repeat protein
MSEQFPADDEAPKSVFISYSRNTGQSSAIGLHAALGGPQGVAFLDTQDIADGDKFPQKLAEAILGAKVFVAVLDATYIKRLFCLRELKLALSPFEHPSLLEASKVDNTHETSLDYIVVALPETVDLSLLDCLPPQLRNTSWPRASETARLEDLVRARLSSIHTSIGGRLPISTEQSAQELLLTAVAMPLPRSLLRPYFPSNLPASLGERFVGRAEDLFRIHFTLSTLRGDPAMCAALTGAIEGGGGFGKTRLALEYCWRYGPAHYPGGLFWLDADRDQSELERQFHGILREIRPETPDFHVFRKTCREAREELESALRELAEKRPILFVIDNLPHLSADASPPSLSKYCPAIGAVTVLVTSRNHLAEAFVRSMDIDVLSRTASVALLTEGTGMSETISWNDWSDIAAWVGDLPLGLEILNKSLQLRSITPHELLLKSRSRSVTEEVDRHANAIASQVPVSALRGVTQALAISYESLPSKAKRAARLLASLSAAPIPLDLFRALGTAMDLPEVRVALVGRSILTALHGGTSGIEFLGVMHRVMADYIRTRSRRPASDLLQICSAIDSLMTPQRCADPKCWPLLNACLPHVRDIFLRTSREYAGPTSAPGMVRTLVRKALTDCGLTAVRLQGAVVAVGRCARDLMYSQGLYDEALSYAEATSRLADAAFGPKSEPALFARLGVADALRLQNDASKRQASLERARQLEQEVIVRSGATSRTRMAAVNNLANTFLLEGRVFEAKRALEEVLEFDQRVLGERHRETITTLHNLATASARCGYLLAARETERKAYELYRQVMGPEHPDTLRSLACLADIEPDESRRVEMLQSAFAAHKTYCGDAHPATVTVLETLATAFLVGSRLPEAVLAWEELVILTEKLPGSDRGTRLAFHKNWLALVLWMSGDASRAAKLLNDSAEARHRLQTNDSEILIDIGPRVKLLSDADTEKIPAFYRAFIDVYSAVLGRNHPDTLRAMESLGMIFTKQHRLLEARELIEGAVNSWLRLGTDHEHILSCKTHLAEIMAASGEVSQARRLFEDVLESMRGANAQHWQLLDVVHHVVVTAIAERDFELARSLLDENLREFRKATGGSDSALALDAMHKVAQAYSAAGMPDDARMLEERVLAGRTSMLGEMDNRTIDAGLFLVKAYYACKEYQTARNLSKTLLERCMAMFPDRPGGPIYLFEVPWVLFDRGSEELAFRIFDQASTASVHDMTELTPVVEAFAEACARLLGSEHPATLTAAEKLVGAYQRDGRNAEAQRICREAVVSRSRVLGITHLETIASKRKLAEIMVEAGDLKAAREIQDETLKAVRKSQTPKGVVITLLLQDLLGTVIRQGDFGAAAELFGEIVDENRAKTAANDAQALKEMGLLAGLHRKAGNMARARSLYEDVLKAQTLLLGADHVETVKTKDGLALVLESVGDLADGRRLREEIVSARRKLLSASDPLLAESISSLAVTVGKQGDVALASELRHEIAETKRTFLGPDHPDTLSAMHDLAEAYRNGDQLARARGLFEQVLEARIRLLGAERLETLETVFVLARTLLALEERSAVQDLCDNFLNQCLGLGLLSAEEAMKRLLLVGVPLVLLARGEGALAGKFFSGEVESMEVGVGERGLVRDALLQASQRYMRADDPRLVQIVSSLETAESQNKERDLEALLEQRKISLGEDHPDTLQTALELASIYSGLGHREKKRALQEWVLEKQRSVLGDEHVDALRTARDLAATLIQMQEYLRARDLESWVLAARKRALGDEHLDTLETAASVVRILEHLQDYSQARDLGASVLERRTKVLGADHVDTLRLEHSLARICFRLNEFAEGRDLASRVLEKRRQMLGEDHKDTVSAAESLVWALWWTGECEKSLELNRSLLERKKKTLRDTDPLTLENADLVAWMYYELGMYARSQELYEWVIEKRNETLGARHPDTLSSMIQLALNFVGSEQYGKAEKLLNRAVEFHEALGQLEHSNMGAAHRGLGKLFAARNDAVRAGIHFEKALQIRRKQLGLRERRTVLTAWDYYSVLVKVGDHRADGIFEEYLRWIEEADADKLEWQVKEVRRKLLIGS